MKFWDSSAIVPLLVPEPTSDRVTSLLHQDDDVCVWTYTATEVWSAIHRRVRDGGISRPELPNIRKKLDILQKEWVEVLPHPRIRDRAHRLLAVHPLRAADALQLAAALAAFDDIPEGAEFVSFDRVLCDAAEKEGFVVL